VSALEYDVVVVGAGPSGSAAAAAAARGGLRVLVIDQEPFPRIRSCGGALVSPALRALADLPPVPSLASPSSVSFSMRGGPSTLRDWDAPLVRTVDRAEFDDWLVAAAVEAGADFMAPCKLLGVAQTGDDVLLTTTAGELSARVVVAADGPLGVLAGEVGVTTFVGDLGVSLELEAGPLAAAWADRMHIDLGPVPGSYAWIYPHGDLLNVGVVSRHTYARDARIHLWQLLKWQRLDWMPVVRESGRIIRTRTDDSPLSNGRILAVGEAAGLVDPWSREGISYALRSGRIAGEIAAIGVIADSSPDELGDAYLDALSLELLPELADGALCLAAFERRPAVFHQILTRTRTDWRTFRRVVSDETAVARLAHTGDVDGVVAAVRAEFAVTPAAEAPDTVPDALTGTEGTQPALF
jgi:geranylgeranyl reductase family protein